MRGPSRLCKRMPRNYDNGDRTSHRLHRRSWYNTLRPMRMPRRVQHDIMNERNDLPQFTWASQNNAAAAMLLRGIPEPIDP